MTEKAHKRGLGTGLGALFGEDTLDDEINSASNMPI